MMIGAEFALSEFATQEFALTRAVSVREAEWHATGSDLADFVGSVRYNAVLTATGGTAVVFASGVRTYVDGRWSAIGGAGVDFQAYADQVPGSVLTAAGRARVALDGQRVQVGRFDMVGSASGVFWRYDNRVLDDMPVSALRVRRPMELRRAVRRPEGVS